MTLATEGAAAPPVAATGSATIATAGDVAPSWRRAFRFAGTAWGISHALFLCFFGLAAVAHKLPGSPRPRSIGDVLFGGFNRWDSGHFASIARSGYFHGSYTPPHYDEAFFPGYPVCARAVAEVLGAGAPGPQALRAGLAVTSWAFALVAAVLIYRLAETTSGTIVARRSSVLMLFGPYSVFLVASYSESMFLALALATWLLAREGRWWWAGLLAALASLTRINGLFLALSLAVMLVSSSRREGRSIFRTASLSVLLAPAATLGYFAYLRSHSHSWTTWIDEERLGWGRRTVAPWTALESSLRRVTSYPDFADRFQNALEVVAAVILVWLVIVLVRQRQWPEVTYIGLTAASLLTSTYYLSVPRALVICFPLTLTAARWSTRSRYRALVGIAGAACLGVLVIDSLLFVTNRWAG